MRYTWNHNEEPGFLQLVIQEDHANTGHNCGKDL